jgi:acyl phosphate:glycerol-3-phosphate acyltransferase
LSPLLVALGMSIYLLTLVLTRYFSVSVLFASIGVMVFSLVLFPGVYVVLVVLFAGGVIWLRNRGRPDRWFKGMEPPVWKRGFRRWR